jgi:serine/threonine protein phosphatase PrpC
MSDVKKTNNPNLEIIEKKIINSINKKNEKFQENYKLIKNKKPINSRNNSSKTFGIINKTLKNMEISNLESTEYNITTSSILNTEINTSFNKNPYLSTNFGNKINDGNDNENERFTFSYNYPLDNHKKKNKMLKNLKIPPQKQMLSDKQINSGQDIDKTHIKSNSPRGIIVKKLSPTNNNNNNDNKQSITQINDYFINQINRQSLSPKCSGIRKQINFIDDINKSNLNKIKKLNYMTHTNSRNNSKNAQMKNNKKINNNANSMTNIKGINNINKRNGINDKNNKDSNKNINQDKRIMPLSANNSQNNFLKNNPKNNTNPQNFNQSNKNLLLNYIPLNNKNNGIQNQQINNIPNNYLSQEIINQPNNNIIYQTKELTNIPFQKEFQRLTQINNNIPSQNQGLSAKKENNKKDINVILNKFDASGWIKQYSVFTLPGKDKSGEQKTNQDSFVFKTNINKIRDFNIFGVLDGHGPDGHFISKFASEFIPHQIINNPQIKALTDPEKIYQKLKENNCQIITQSYIEADNKLKNANFDVLESGSTCVLVIHIGSHIICANVGDSRAIVVFDEKGENNVNHFKEIPLSIDYKPEIPEETNRILRSGGVIAQIKDELGEGVGPYRVWARGQDYPGLAMSRSIGDLNAKNIGTIPNPGILEYNLSKNTKYYM